MGPGNANDYVDDDQTHRSTTDNEDDDKDDKDKLKQQRWMLITQAASIFMNTTVAGALTTIELLYNKTPYHTSALTGADWVWELLAGHDKRI